MALFWTMHSKPGSEALATDPDSSDNPAGLIMVRAGINPEPKSR